MATTGVPSQQIRTTTPSTVDGTASSNSEGTSVSMARADHTHATLYTASGGTARTFASKLSDLVSVKDFGVVCDGVTDDTTAIQAAIDAAYAAGGGEVFFPPAEHPAFYAVSDTLTVPSGVHLVGAGGHYSTNLGQSRIGSTSGTNLPVIANSDQTNGNLNIVLRGLRITSGATGGSAHTVDFRGGSAALLCQNVRIIDCSVENARGSTIYLKWTKEAEVRNSWCLNALSHGVCLENCTDVLIHGNQIDTNESGGDGIAILNSGSDASDHNIITANFLFLCDYGIRIQGGKRNIVANNRCNDNRRDGIRLGGFSTNVTAYNVVQGNICLNNGTGLTGTRAGIVLDNSVDRNLVIGNTCSRQDGNTSQSTGIRLSSSAEKNWVVGNYCMGNASTNVQNTSSATDNIVFGNAGAVTSAGHFAMTSGALSLASSTVTYSASMTPNAAAGNEFVITANDGNAFTINAPTNATTGQRITVRLRNTSGGALGAATWNAVFKMAAWTNPATANSRSIDFIYDGTNWVEVARTAADVPN